MPGEYFHTHNEAHPHARLFEHTRIHFELKTSFERVSGSHCAGNESTLHCLGSVHYVLPNPAVSLPTWVMVSKMREGKKSIGQSHAGSLCAVPVATEMLSTLCPNRNSCLICKLTWGQQRACCGQWWKNEQNQGKIIMDTNKNAKITQPPALLLK